MLYKFGVFEFDADASELTRQGRAVKLPPQPARVLALLLSRGGELVLRDELRAHLWGEDTFVDFERGLNFCILQVRSALGDSADSPRFVQTIPRKGYRFIAPVAITQGDLRPRVRPPSPLGDLRPPAGPPSPGETSVPGRWMLAAAALVILAPAAWLATNIATPAVHRTPERIRIAVLPFANLTGSADVDPLVDGLTDELISELGRISPARLAVIARTSAMAYRTTTKPLTEIARELDVSFVIEGSVQPALDDGAGRDEQTAATRDGEGMRVTGRLVPVAQQSPIAVWSEIYTRDGATAIRVAREAALRLLPEATAPNLPPPTRDPAAWDAYLQGRHHLNRGTVADVRSAIALLESAVQRDPAFAGGWAQLAEAHHLMVMIGAAAPRDAYGAAAQAAARALSLDAALADAHVARGIVQLWHDWRPADAARSFERALALNGSHAAAHHDYAWSQVALGRDEQAIAHITAARDLDPMSARANTDVGWLFLHLRRPADARRACQRTLAVHPHSLEARACLERAAPRISPAEMRDMWRQRLRSLEEASRRRWVNPYTLAVHELMLDQTDRAMQHLDAAFEARVGMMVFLARDPAVDRVRSHPRFAALLERVSASAR